MICSKCSGTMALMNASGVVTHVCSSCRMSSIGLGALRKAGVPSKVLFPLWKAAKHGPVSSWPCPSCAAPLKTVQHGALPELELCRRCQLLCFDDGEQGALLMGALGTEPAPAPAPASVLASAAVLRPAMAGDLETVARATPEIAVTLIAQQHQQLPGGLKGLLAKLSVPVELDDAPYALRPWLTWAAVAALWVLGLSAMAWPYSASWDFSADGPAWTVLSFAWIQNSLSEMLLVSWALLTCADDLEALLGRLRLAIACILWMALTAALWRIQYPDGQQLLLGMSGLGTMAAVWYALTFPRRRLGVLWRNAPYPSTGWTASSTIRRQADHMWAPRTRLRAAPIYLVYPLLWVLIGLLEHWLVYPDTGSALLEPERLWPQLTGVLMGMGCWLSSRNPVTEV